MKDKIRLKKNKNNDRKRILHVKRDTKRADKMWTFSDPLWFISSYNNLVCKISEN